VGLNSLKSLNLTNVYPNNNKNNKKNNKVKSKPLELRSRVKILEFFPRGLLSRTKDSLAITLKSGRTEKRYTTRTITWKCHNWCRIVSQCLFVVAGGVCDNFALIGRQFPCIVVEIRDCWWLPIKLSGKMAVHATILPSLVAPLRSAHLWLVGYWLLSSEVFTILGFSDGRIDITDI
jgi:hypothetical protein